MNEWLGVRAKSRVAGARWWLQQRPAPRSEAAVAERFGSVGRALRASRVYAFQNFVDPVTDELCARQRFEWADLGIEPQIENPALQRLSYRDAGVESWIDSLARGVPVTMRAGSQGEADALMAAQQIRSALIVPVIRDDPWWGFVGVDDCEQARDWQPAEVRLLEQLAAQLAAVTRGPH